MKLQHRNTNVLLHMFTTTSPNVGCLLILLLDNELNQASRTIVPSNRISVSEGRHCDIVTSASDAGHDIWVPVHVMVALVPVQLSVSVPGNAGENGVSLWALGTYTSNVLDGDPGSCL